MGLRRLSRLVFGLLLSAALLAGCVYNKAVPIGGNVWVMETDGRGAYGAEIAATQTLQDAAQLALSQGYSYFLLEKAPDNQRDIGVRAVLYGSTRTVAYGSGAIPPNARAPAGQTSGGALGGPPDVRTRVAVVMLRNDDPRVPQAYRALGVLAGTE